LPNFGDFKKTTRQQRLSVSISKNVALAKKLAIKNANLKALELRKNANRYFIERS
jgi:hypothetical protein